MWFWHRWLGLAAMAVLLIAAASGSLLVFKKPLVRWLVTPDSSLPGDYGSGQMARELDRIAAMLPLREPMLIKAPNPEEPYWTLTDPQGNVRLFDIDSLLPYSDQLHVLDVLAFTRKLHIDLLAGVPGETLLLAGGVLGLTLCVTGLVLWWPTRRLFRWQWVWPRPVRKSLMLQYHRHAGAAAAVILILVLLTGSVMLWQGLIRPLLPPAPVKVISPDTITAGAGYDSQPSALFNMARNQVPDGWPTYIRLPSAATAEASFRFRLPGEWHPNGRTSVSINTASGEMRVSVRSDEATPGRMLLNQLYPLHSGYGMNTFYMFLVMLGGVFLLWLCITGLYSYIRRASRF